MINEIAPRPHNSGHHTIEACETSQFENHLRAILSLPLGSTALRVPSAAMLNLIGTSEAMAPIEDACRAAYEVPGATVHLYGKKECRRGRKMGHITVTGSSDAQVRERIRPILDAMPDLAKSFIDAISGPPPSSSSATTTATTTISPSTGFSHPQPLVGIIMGSDSDLPTLLPAARILDTFHIPYELTICSAHRTPARMVTYAKEAAGRGLRCIIAGAGGAAHLPGMVASETTLPVVGVPVKGSVLDGVDSLYSIVQMPVSPARLAVLRHYSPTCVADISPTLLSIARNPCSDRRYRKCHQRRPPRDPNHRLCHTRDRCGFGSLCSGFGKRGVAKGGQDGGDGMGRVCEQGVEKVTRAQVSFVMCHG